MRALSIIFVILSVFFSLGNAQQTPLYSQYILNEFIINPAVAGIDGMTSVNLSGRKQWLGWEYAPETYSVSVSTRILKSSTPFYLRKKNRDSESFRKGSSGRVGLGAALVKDRNGAIDKTSMNLTYSYHLPLIHSQMSFGLTFLANEFSINRDRAQFFQEGDPAIGLLGRSTFSPDAAFGFDYYTKRYHIGLSINNLFQTPVTWGDGAANTQEIRQVRHYFVLGSYRDYFPSSDYWEYEPSFLARFTETFQGTAEASIRFIYDREYWAGFSFRSSKEIIILMGLKLNMFYFGYSFDYGFSEIARQTYGSHEVSMAIKIGDGNRRYRYWERY